MLKFRVWDNHNECYSEEPYWRLLLCKDGKIYNSENDTYYNFDERYTVEFSTGLKDRNGKDIFEGDILRCPFQDKMETSKSVKTKYFDLPVTFENGSFNFKIGRTKIHPYRFHPQIEDCEIIGNIHDKTNENAK